MAVSSEVQATGAEQRHADDASQRLSSAIWPYRSCVRAADGGR